MVALQFYGGYRFQDLFYWFQQFGVLDFLLPFLLIFTAIYAIMSRVKIFKDNKFNVIISLVIALVTVGQHVLYPTEFSVVSVINRALPEFAFIIIVIILALILVGAVGGGTELQKGKWLGYVAFLALLGFIIVLYRALYPGFTPAWLAFLDDPAFQTLIIALIIFGLIVWFVTREQSETPTESLGGRLQKLFGGK